MLESLQHFDYTLFDLVNQQFSFSFFDRIMPVLRTKETWIPMYLVIAILMIWKEKKRALWIIGGVVLAVVAADVISSHLMKPFFERTRPCNVEHMKLSVRLILDHCSGAYSFPSSHAANHFALAVSLGLIYREHKWVLVVGLFWAAIIAYAQIYVGVHFPSDVLFGALLGALIGWISYRIFKVIDNKFKPQLND